MGYRHPVQFIPDRKKAYENYKQLPSYPAVINGGFDPFKWAANPHRRLDYYRGHASETDIQSTILTGAAGAAGVTEGVVRCLAQSDHGDQLETDEILRQSRTHWFFRFIQWLGLLL